MKRRFGTSGGPGAVASRGGARQHPSGVSAQPRQRTEPTERTKNVHLEDELESIDCERWSMPASRLRFAPAGGIIASNERLTLNSRTGSTSPQNHDVP